MQITKIFISFVVILGGCVPVTPFVLPEDHPASLKTQEVVEWTGPAVLNHAFSSDEEKSDQAEIPISSAHHHMHGGH